MDKPTRPYKWLAPAAWVGVLAAGMLAAGGCGGVNTDYVTVERLDRGLTILLPGIEGEGMLSYQVRSGLLRAGVDMALPIYQWGRPVPLAGPLLNQMDVAGNRTAAEQIARMIVNYQDTHPDRPVYIVGHSGGGGVAVFSAEALPPGRMVDGLILLSASISSGYDLSKALARCRLGIVNFHSKGDVGLLVIGTTLVGNVDGGHGPAAGAIGFEDSFPGLHEVGWSPDMARAGNFGGHSGTCEPRFVSRYVAPWLDAAGWPARSSTISLNR
ncbi:MAG TPA: hypothetical protein VM389_07335 [Phycisphaerae bacterium]|nr:hypothetical protein [Phycisphaerae bacterium]HUU22335.1 hypothetical protein [Phycisphaerae bacterium]